MSRTPAPDKLLTAEEFDCLPEPDAGKLELVEGRAVHLTPVNAEHGRLTVKITGRLDDFVSSHSLGEVYVETGFRIATGPDVVHAPGISFVRADRVPPLELRRRGSLPQAPDLAVEVTSPSDTDADVQAKVERYLAAGTPRMWVVRPELATVTVHRTGGDAHTYHRDDTLSSDDAGFEAPGFALPLATLFSKA